MGLTRLVASITLGLLISNADAAWEYETKKDPMGRGETKFATLASNNSLSLKFPYQGPNKGEIFIQRIPPRGTEVVIQLDKGQLSCSLGCKFVVRFDEGKATTWAATGAAGGHSNAMFPNNSAAFLAKLRTAKKVLIELDVYSNGSQILEFSPAGLDWK